MSDKILQVARFTAQQTADAVARTYGSPITVEVQEEKGMLYYVVSSHAPGELPTWLPCSRARLADVMAVAGSLFHGLQAL